MQPKAALENFWATVNSVWPDWVIYWTLGRFLKPLAPINLPKSPTFFGNFCKGVKIYPFSSEIIFGQLLYTFGDFFRSHWPWRNQKAQLFLLFFDEKRRKLFVKTISKMEISIRGLKSSHQNDNDADDYDDGCHLEEQTTDQILISFCGLWQMQGGPHRLKSLWQKFNAGLGCLLAQWIRLHLPSCRPGFKTQQHHLHFYQFKFEFKMWLVEKTKINRKRGRDCSIFILKKFSGGLLYYYKFTNPPRRQNPMN